MSETTLLYVLSTLAQTCAALAAFVGAVGVFRLQLLRDQRKDVERGLRLMTDQLGTIGADIMHVPMDRVLRGIDKGCEKHGHGAPIVQAVLKERGRWEAFVPRLRGSRRALIIFEVWNLAVIGGALVGFNHLPALTSAGWTSWALWAVAVGTVLVTLYCVIVWTRGVEE